MFDELKDKNLDEKVAKLFFGWSLAYNDGPSFLTDEARKRCQYVVKKTLPPFSAPNGESVWEGSTPFEALGKAMNAFTVKEEKHDDSMDYDEDAILDAGAVLNELYNINSDGAFYWVNKQLKELLANYSDADSYTVKNRLESFVDYTDDGYTDLDIAKENESFIDFLRKEIVNEDYTLARHIIKNEVKK